MRMSGVTAIYDWFGYEIPIKDRYKMIKSDEEDEYIPQGRKRGRFTG